MDFGESFEETRASAFESVFCDSKLIGNATERAVILGMMDDGVAFLGVSGIVFSSRLWLLSLFKRKSDTQRMTQDVGMASLSEV